MTSSRREPSDNPYVAPHSDSETPAQTIRGDLTLVRLIFYAHLFAVILCAILSSHDAGQLKIPDGAWNVLRHLAPALLVSWVLFPSAMTVVVARLRNRATLFRLLIIASDVLLSIFQLWTLMPLVQ